MDIRDTAGNTLLIIAAQNGNKNMCKVRHNVYLAASADAGFRHFFVVAPT